MFPNPDAIRCEPTEFMRMALLVLGDELKYKDEVIAIKRNPLRNDDFIGVIRVSNNNPVTMQVNGKVIRHHGEHIHLTKHLQKLVDELI